MFLSLPEIEAEGSSPTLAIVCRLTHNQERYNTDVNPDVGKQPWKNEFCVSCLGAFEI
jgi:hypothetical protein